jgi:hypothetical protein
MMEIEFFAKGYFTVGGFPQYYRIFWGIVSSISKTWSNGVTTVNISCRDILRWWELTNVILQPGFLEGNKSAGRWNLFQNRFSGVNPYAIIITLAREAMGDFSLTTGSFLSYRPEQGAQQDVIAPYAKDIMAYWQLKFGNIWNNLVLYGTSGIAYTFAGLPGNTSSSLISRKIFEQEESSLDTNPETAAFKIQPHEIAAFKVDVSRAGDVEFFQNEIQSKLSVAMTAAAQAGAYEFYCDTTGDIIFKPPFFNLNVIPNKPVSWIQDFEIMDENLSDTEQEVVTHVTASGNAFGGVTDWGLNDDITTPHTGVMDWHLLKRYGWRRLDVQLEWAGNMRKVFYHLLDHMDKINAKRQNGTLTIPLRPELRMGFPIWFPKYDCFYYVQGISHAYAPGGTASTTLTLIGKRSKFIAPKNIGAITKSGSRTITDKARKGNQTRTRVVDSYKIEFPSSLGDTTGVTDAARQGQTKETGGPAILRDAKTGKLLGFPNVVMCYRTTLSGAKLGEILRNKSSKKQHKPKKQDKKSARGSSYSYSAVIGAVFQELQGAARASTIDRLRSHRYEAGMTNAGAYDYAHDEGGVFKEFSIVPSDHILWGTGTDDPDKGTEGGGETQGTQSAESKKKAEEAIAKIVERLEEEKKPLKKARDDAKKEAAQASRDLQKYKRDTYKGGKFPPNNELTEADKARKQIKADADTKLVDAEAELKAKEAEITQAKLNQGSIKRLPAINTMVRPVSDEFGFETIGHYRYGRGVYIDRGQMQIPDPATVGSNPSVANKLNIQFAAHGGLLTDNPKQRNIGLESQNFAEAFESMQPDDYVTGASFKGANYTSDATVSGTGPDGKINPTGQRTYTDAINNSVTKAGKAVFVEADALRRSVTLAELKPTLDGFPKDVAFEKCSCSLNRTDWLSVLPQSFIREVLSAGSVNIAPQTEAEKAEQEARIAQEAAIDAAVVAASDSDLEGTGIAEIAEIEAEGAAEVAADAVAYAEEAAAEEADQDPSSVIQIHGDFVNGPGGFFSVLHDYLVDRFSRDYEGDNMHRERYAIGGGRDVLRPHSENLQNPPDLFGSPGGSLFDRAALGDVEALEALKGDVNFNFDGTQEAWDDWRKNWRDIQKDAEEKFAANAASIECSFDVDNPFSTGGVESPPPADPECPPPQPQPPTPDEPPPLGRILANRADFVRSTDPDEPDDSDYFNPLGYDPDEDLPTGEDPDDLFDPFGGSEEGEPEPPPQFEPVPTED